MPKRTTSDDDDDAPPRRRRRAAVAVDAEVTRGFAMRLLMRSPKDVVAGFLAFAATSAIVTNALFLQTGPHPAPMFGSFAAPVASTPALSLLPRPRPAEADIAEPKPAEPKPAEPKLAEPKSADALANLVRATAAGGAPAPANIIRPPAPVPAAHNETTASVGSRRIMAVQRALTDYGYGQLKPTGTMGADTQAAIQKFERERKLPVTGQMSERLVRELAAVIGHPID